MSVKDCMRNSLSRQKLSSPMKGGDNKLNTPTHRQDDNWVDQYYFSHAKVSRSKRLGFFLFI